jgi:hypothetical protein
LDKEKKESIFDRIRNPVKTGYEFESINNPILNLPNNRNLPITKNITDTGFSKKVVNVYVYFVGRAYRTVDFERVRRDFARANEIWNRCMIYIRIANGNGVPIVNKMTYPNFLVNNLCAENLGHQHRTGPADRIRDALIENFTPNKSIALFYIPGKVFYRSGIACAVTGNEVSGSSFKSSIFMAADSDYPYILAHELGHALFFRPRKGSGTNPGPAYVIPGTRKLDSAHDNRSENLMYPTVPNDNPIITKEQCNKARQSPYIYHNS